MALIFYVFGACRQARTRAHDRTDRSEEERDGRMGNMTVLIPSRVHDGPPHSRFLAAVLGASKTLQVSWDIDSATTSDHAACIFLVLGVGPPCCANEMGGMEGKCHFQATNTWRFRLFSGPLGKLLRHSWVISWCDASG